MRKLLLLLSLVICTYASAQKGWQGIGIEALGSAIASKPFSMGVSVKYQYGLTDMFRIEPFFVYYVSESVDGPDGSTRYDTSKCDRYPRMTLGANLQTLFYKGNRIWSYLITGASYSHLRYQPYIESYDYNGQTIFPDKYELSENKFGGNFGLGVDFRASYNLNVTLQIGYNTAAKEFVGIGVVYNFKTKEK